ncbi:MAG: hypothetical protein KKB90_05620 [Actinobacteria bacterium]|nr:hypothetical protein [Actinomycetota bacterium]MCG2818184.1 hypothetical protein [Actinomycetes bacterium]MBU4218426.1 hypothetical protein [Actinomycetota bacterium]MBU4358483.1 hypothetical protein [Actinomycetota bacterium]MBU4393106.1 hypothetical protein [Actinomycetota bacterium]
MLMLGALLAVVATVLINYSNYLMKKELDNLPRIGSESALRTIRAFLNCRPWLKAQGIQILGAWTHNVAVGLAPLSVVQPINASGICLLVILAVTKLHEKASVVDWVGIGSIVLGVILLGISLVNTPSVELKYHSVILWSFILLMMAVSVSALTAALVRKDERTSSFLGIGVGMLVGLTAILTKIAWIDVANRWAEYRVAGVLYSSYFWMAVIFTIVAMVFFQTALQRGAAIVVIPLVTGFSNLIPTVVGFLAFHEPFPSGALMGFFRLASIFLIIGGAVILSLRKEGGAAPKKVYTENSCKTVYQ